MMLVALRRREVWFLVLPVLISGCGAGYAAVQGAVTLDGAPVESGYVSFIPTDKAAPTGRAGIVKGRYAIDSTGQLKPGSYRVEVHTTRKTGKKVAAGSPAPQGTMVDEEVDIIPEKYKGQSTLQKELKLGANTIDLDAITSGS